MVRTELLEIIANGESSRVAFKRDSISTEQLAENMVAVANSKNGCLLLGVEDDGTITGIQRENTEQWVIDTILNKIHPRPWPSYKEIRLDSATVSVIDFSRERLKPYVVRRDNGREEVYVRIGSDSRRATQEQQIRLSEAGNLLKVERLPVSRACMSDLDEARLTCYLRDILCDPDIPKTPEEWKKRLLDLGFMTGAREGTVCTIAGLILFGKSPRKRFTQAGLRVMAFDGTDKECQNLLLDDTIDGPVAGLWETRNGTRHLIDGGIVDRFMDIIRPLVCEGNKQRELRWLLPPDAIQETLFNALAHRDWTYRVDIEVVLYSDRLEVTSPGALVDSMDIVKMRRGRRSPRNTAIWNVLRDYGYIDGLGMGVKTKVALPTRELTGKDPEFVETDYCLKTILYR